MHETRLKHTTEIIYTIPRERKKSHQLTHPPHMSNHLSSDSDISSTESMLCGGIAGMVSRFCIAPLDVIKIRLQLQKNGTRYYRGIFHTMRQIVRDEGVTALWKGNIPAELLYVFYGATQFVTYHHVNQVIP